MNKRIQELAEQADINIDSFQFSGTPIKYIVGESSLEKFAELIVRECIGIIDEEGSHEGGSIRSMEAIKQYFGVEE